MHQFNNSISLQDIHQLAGGLNIEGGFPCLDLHKTNPNGKWINLILVLDRPLIDKITFDEILKNNKYFLLENAIENLNEKHFFAAYLMIIGYYLENGHKIFNKNENEILSVTIHIHQDKISIALISILGTYVNLLIKNNNLQKNIALQYLTDDTTYICSNHNYGRTDLLISLGQCAGIEPTFMPGTLLIPKQFIPYNISKRLICAYAAYDVENQLIIDLNDILNSKYNDYAVTFINKNYVSANPNKNDMASKIKMEDFKLTNILQADELWNPTNPKELVSII
jgi:hypothetical protein